MRRITNVAIFRALQLGDMLCAIPSIRAFKKAYPQTRLTLMGLPWAKEFVERFSHYFEDFMAFPGFPGLPEQPVNESELLRFISVVRHKQFDLLLQMHGNGSIVNSFITHLNANYIAGFYEKGQKRPSDYFTEYPDYVPERERLNHLMRFLHTPVEDTSLEFPISPLEEKSLLRKPFMQNLTSPFICIHPGAREEKRQWSPLYFALVADALAEKYTIVLTGVDKELPLIQKVQLYMKKRAVIAAGQLSLGETACLLKRASLLIANCTGIVHIADALHVPSIVMYLASDPMRWAPVDSRLHIQIKDRQTKNPLLVTAAANQLMKNISSLGEKGKVL